MAPTSGTMRHDAVLELARAAEAELAAIARTRRPTASETAAALAAYKAAAEVLSHCCGCAPATGKEG